MISLDLGVLLPVLAPVAGAVLVLAVDVALPTVQRVHYVLAFAALLVGGGGTLGALGTAPADASRTLCLPGGSPCFYAVSGLSATLQLAALLAAAVTLLLAWPLEQRREAGRTAVMVALVLAATSGAVGVAAARDLGSWLVTLELATLPVVALAALPGTRRAIAGAVQLLTTSIVSFAVLALAAACWFAATGTPTLLSGSAAAASSGPQRGLLSLSVVLVLAGVGFKLSLVPFHAWTPTTYAGSPLPIAVFLAGVSKVAALGALLVVISAVTSLGRPGLVGVAVLAIASMTLGNVMALRQDDVVRLLAWSTVAQAGWVVLPLLSVTALGVSASAGYLVTYLVATLVAFTVVAVTLRGGAARAGRRLTAYRGLLRSQPLVGGALALALMSLAGLPPGLLGLIGKVVALRPVLVEGWWFVAVLAAINAVLGVAVYLRWFRALLAPAAAPTTSAPTTPAPTTSAPTTAAPTRGGGLAIHPSHVVALALGSIALVVLSLAPQLFLGPLG